MVSDILTLFRRWLELEQKTVPTTTPARPGASKPTIGGVARGEAVERGRGRGRKRTPSRGRGQTPGPASNRAVTPPPTDEVVREGEERENKQVQDEELPPQPTPEMIKKKFIIVGRISAICIK